MILNTNLPAFYGYYGSTFDYIGLYATNFEQLTNE